jgi:hypothetical protein
MAAERLVLISGSRAAWRTAGEWVSPRRGIALRVMPEALTQREVSAHSADAWTRELAELIASNARVLVTIGSTSSATAAPPSLARRLAASAVRAIQQAGTVERVLAEGGATAAAVASAFGWTRLDVVGQPAPGVVALEAPSGGGPQFVIKVGSYEWPAAVWGAE